MICPLINNASVKDSKEATYPSEMIQVLEGWSDKVLLTTNTTFDCEFFSFCKQTAATEPTLCHAVA